MAGNQLAQRGFTIVEVLVAVMLLSVGLLALVGSAAVATRMISQGRRYTEASAEANQRLEILRSQTCAAMSDGSATQGRFTVAWTVTTDATGRARQVALQVVSPTATGTRRDLFQTVILC
jgi:prepilin-type N-terminal cleavage/methylation domain-containing protein